ncbi:hypothetical protein MJG53_001454 [Ovis ammon polii x Ovis aries]|uniref:Uncharacterized protein n=1 Tax=Ovis ammon polii x Ovis aries TaxID=2918886 RepID=A0ACB9VKL0_9CETA|nr:hypothetical protein MJG53_001454 [Ovis ammon polii x Ovis aries]
MGILIQESTIDVLPRVFRLILRISLNPRGKYLEILEALRQWFLDLPPFLCFHNSPAIGTALRQLFLAHSVCSWRPLGCAPLWGRQQHREERVPEVLIWGSKP